eukprot:CAMPEP_0203794880 /NCGR_PEP_ID=MMETSP0100_2-20121128/6830_1 /ASSEMBLY_ACC=CAM_ASM_000210 /TAXON_ID=96639 /ORGANISM=" , Strain NY0313808BC1" /LENGTH=59 /DNA_ID=CAMNT_0050699147 /DNA_START=609 /DNA_END=788 /DNA_ORIENTATION=-
MTRHPRSTSLTVLVRNDKVVVADNLQTLESRVSVQTESDSLRVAQNLRFSDSQIHPWPD